MEMPKPKYQESDVLWFIDNDGIMRSDKFQTVSVLWMRTMREDKKFSIKYVFTGTTFNYRSERTESQCFLSEDDLMTHLKLTMIKKKVS